METDRAWVSNRIRDVAIFRQVRFHSLAEILSPPLETKV
eukprot:COSAG06_NODE_65357_length_257_cov_0.651899_1_plen_38_part_10